MGVFLECKMKKDAMKRIEILTVKLLLQFPEKRNLLRGKRFAVEIISIGNFNATTVTASNSFNGI